MITFGTAGFRGIIGDNFTKANIQKIGAAFAAVLRDDHKKTKVIVGYDNRFMGKEYAGWFCEAACGEGLDATFMSIPVPTTFVAYKTASDFPYGIMITASHNPYNYNGIKVMLGGGKDADDDFYARVSEKIAALESISTTKLKDLVAAGVVTMSDDASDYVDKICSMLDAKKIKSSGLRVLCNPMHGSGADIMKQVFDRVGVDYTMINDHADPMFGGRLPAPYPHNLISTAAEVVKGKFDFGFALDGDGDRITFIDGDGIIYECNFVAAVFYYYFTKIKGQKGGFAKNFVTSNLTTKLCEQSGEKAFESRVGFKFLAPIMEKENIIVAAEGTSIAFPQVSLSKDGVAAAAFLVDLIADTKKGIGEMIDEIAAMVSFPSKCLEVAYMIDESTRSNLLAKLLSGDAPKFDRALIRRDGFPDGYKLTLEGDYWCSARLSGTESIIRLIVEMPTAEKCEEVVEILRKHYNLSERQK